MDIRELKKICIDDNIPFVRDNTLNFIIHQIQDNDYHTVLEIGTAYGYSAKAFSLITGIKEVISLERNTKNFEKAKEFLSADSKIKLINANAFDFQPKRTYDFIFIDGPKSHQEQLVTKYLTYLDARGTMVVDNIYLKKYRDAPFLTRNQQNLLKKIRAFQQ
jgi:predicted O-methyltransferase YrrM